MTTQKIQMPKMRVIPQEEVAERAAAEKMEKAMRERFSEKEFPKEYERFGSFLKTLDAEKIRLSITDKTGKTEEHSFSTSEAPGQAWRLLAARENGALVKVEPESQNHAFIVVSGLTESSLKTMREDGYGAALVTETDAGRFQAVFKVRAGAEGERKEISETLTSRYGNGQHDGIVVPGFYGSSLNRIPRVVSCNESAPVLGPGRLTEKLREQAPRYEQQETAMRAFAAEQPAQQQTQAQTVQHRQEDGYTPKKEETQAQGQENSSLYKKEDTQEQQQGAAQGNSLFSMLLSVLRAIALMLREAFAHALGRVRVPGLSVQEHKSEPPYWRDKSQWQTEELLQNPAFSREQKEAALAPQEVQEVKAQAQEQVKSQEQTKVQKRKGRSR